MLFVFVNLMWNQSAHCWIPSSNIRCSDTDGDNSRKLLKLGEDFSVVAKTLETFTRH